VHSHFNASGKGTKIKKIGVAGARRGNQKRQLEQKEWAGMEQGGWPRFFLGQESQVPESISKTKEPLPVQVGKKPSLLNGKKSPFTCSAYGKRSRGPKENPTMYGGAEQFRFGDEKNKGVARPIRGKKTSTNGNEKTKNVERDTRDWEGAETAPVSASKVTPKPKIWFQRT